MAILARFQAHSRALFSMTTKTNDSESDLKQALLSESSETKKPEETKVKILGDSTTTAKKRVYKELSKLNNEEMQNCSFGPVDAKNRLNLQGIIIGPSETPFEGGIFIVSIVIPSDYPFKPPKIKFKNKVFHPNVGSDGTLLVDMLDSQWTPAITIHKILISISSYLAEPSHAQDSCNQICGLYWNNRKAYDTIAQEWTIKYAML